MMNGKQERKYRIQKNSGSATPKLTLDRFCLLEDLFNEKGWIIKKEIEYSLFSRFHKTLSLLKGNEQDLVLKLSRDFVWIPSRDYTDHLIVALRKLKESIGDKMIFFVPCKPETEDNENKSSNSVLYLINDTEIQHEIELGNYQVLKARDGANEDMLVSKEAVLVMVDDFIGTGDTAVKALADIRNNYTKLQDYDSIKILCLVTQQKGLDVLTPMGVDVYYSLLAPMGISDNNNSEEEQLHDFYVMDGIESHIKDLEDKFHYGYKKSEALVSMIRCPNNTFPIYWAIPNISPYERKK